MVRTSGSYRIDSAHPCTYITLWRSDIFAPADFADDNYILTLVVGPEAVARIFASFSHSFCQRSEDCIQSRLSFVIMYCHPYL